MSKIQVSAESDLERARADQEGTGNSFNLTNVESHQWLLHAEQTRLYPDRILMYWIEKRGDLRMTKDVLVMPVRISQVTGQATVDVAWFRNWSDMLESETCIYRLVFLWAHQWVLNWEERWSEGWPNMCLWCCTTGSCTAWRTVTVNFPRLSILLFRWCPLYTWCGPDGLEPGLYQVCPGRPSPATARRVPS